MLTLIQSPTPHLSKSLDFYQRLGFAKVNDHIVSDGSVFIDINADRYARAGIKMYKTSWQDEFEQLKDAFIYEKKDFGYLFADPSGVWVYLIEVDSMPNLQHPETGSGKLGTYAGISLESISLAKSLAFYSILGFSPNMGSPEQGWVAMSNAEGTSISMMKADACPHLFFNPSLTYFNGGNNLPIIEGIRVAGVAITEEITHFNKEGIVDNVIIRDPGGLGFFIFND